MKNLARIFSLITFLSASSLSLNAAAATVIDFATGFAGSGGTIDATNGGNDAVGAGILIGAMTVDGAPANDGVYTVNAILAFDTQANTLSITGDIGAFGIFNQVLLSGTFTNWTFDTNLAGNDVFAALGPDTKNTQLLASLGLNINTPFEYFGFSIESKNNSVISTDIVNTAVPVPAAVWLFGSGLLGLAGVARRRA